MKKNESGTPGTPVRISLFVCRMGPPLDSVNRCLKKVAEKTMVYGRYNYT